MPRAEKKPAIRCDCLLSSRRAVGHLPLSRAADGAPCSLRGKHGLVVLVQHVLVPVEVGEIPFYSRMRQIPCESCWKARCLSWTGSAGSLSAGLSSPVGSRRPRAVGQVELLDRGTRLHGRLDACRRTLDSCTHQGGLRRSDDPKPAGLEATERPSVGIWTCHRGRPVVGCIERLGVTLSSLLAAIRAL